MEPSLRLGPVAPLVEQRYPLERAIAEEVPNLKSNLGSDFLWNLLAERTSRTIRCAATRTGGESSITVQRDRKAAHHQH